MTAGQPLHPQVLLLSSRIDFACDYVISALRELGVPYLRLNSEDLDSMELALSPSVPRLRVYAEDDDYVLEPDSLKGIFFRRPVYLREAGTGSQSGPERLARSQWGVFLRSLMVFEQARWINHPARVYFAEHKAVQLLVARQAGFRIPETVITNSARHLPAGQSTVAIKGLETILFSEGEREFFGYTQVVERDMLSAENLSALPTVVQAAVAPKVDLRVTVVGTQMWCAEIHGLNGAIPGDWRELKDAVTYRPRGVPDDLRQCIVALMDRLGLAYGAIDLAERNGQIYFLEINPTGEWAWLEKQLGFPVSQELVRLLGGER